jgi:hypothetical protein
LRESEAQQAAQLEQEIREEERKARERRTLDEMAVRIPVASCPPFTFGLLCMICPRGSGKPLQHADAEEAAGVQVESIKLF